MATSTTEVNDLLVKLSATAHNVHGREGVELMCLISRLSSAVTRERAAGVTELQGLRKKILQQPSNSMHPGALPRGRSEVPVVRPTAMVPNFGNFSQDRLNAVLSGRPLSPTYEPKLDHELGPKCTDANSLPLGPRGQKRDAWRPESNDDLRLSIVRSSRKQQSRKRALSPSNNPAAKKVKVLPQVPTQPKRPEAQDSQATFYGLACYECIASGSRCNNGIGRKCTRCQPHLSMLGECVFLPCPSENCKLPNCPLVHRGQCISQPGKVDPWVLGINIEESILGSKEIKTMKRATLKVETARDSFKKATRLQAQLQQSQPSMQAKPTTLPASTAATPLVQDGRQQALSNGAFTGPQASNTMPRQGSTFGSETRDPRLIAKAKVKSTEPRSDPVPATGLSQERIQQPDRVAELTHARITGVPLGKASAFAAPPSAADIIDRPGSPGTRIGSFEKSSYTASNPPGPTLAEQQRSVEELLQSLAPFGTSFASPTAAPSRSIASQSAPGAAASDGAAVTAEAQSAVPRSIVAEGLLQASMNPAPAIKPGVAMKVDSLEFGSSGNGRSTGGLEEGQVEEVKAEDEIKPEPSVKMEMDE